MPETILMIHGMWGGGWCWDHFSVFFEKRGYRCITPTLRYHDINPNDDPDPRLGTVSLIEYADDLEKLIRALDDPIILMGHSMGGLLTQILASRNEVDAAVLLTPASPHGIMALTPTVVRSFWSIIKTWGYWKKPIRQTFKEASYSTLGVLPDDMKMAVFDRFVYESGRAAFEIAFWYFDPKNASKVDESQVTCPVLIIGGTEDKLTPTSVVRKIAVKYKKVAAYKEFEDHGHWIIGEPDWENIAAYASNWLDEVLRLKRFKAGAQVEQRKNKRTEYHALIAFTSSDSDSFYQGEMQNFSRGGLHFKSNVEINPGSIINIKWIDSVPEVIASQKKATSSAEVIWYRQGKDNFIYDIGVKFSENHPQ